MRKQLTLHDLHSLRRVLRHVSTSDTAVQAEALRLEELLAAVITQHRKETP